MCASLPFLIKGEQAKQAPQQIVKLLGKPGPLPKEFQNTPDQGENIARNRADQSFAPSHSIQQERRHHVQL